MASGIIPHYKRHKYDNAEWLIVLIVLLQVLVHLEDTGKHCSSCCSLPKSGPFRIDNFRCADCDISERVLPISEQTLIKSDGSTISVNGRMTPTVMHTTITT